MTQVRSNEQVAQTASVVAEKGKEYGSKGWGLMRGLYANVASQVESVASEHGYKVDLGARQWTLCVGYLLVICYLLLSCACNTLTLLLALTSPSRFKAWLIKRFVGVHPCSTPSPPYACHHRRLLASGWQ